ncbi:MAG: PAS domain-containing sensor histidine kinase [Cyanobacteriota bacterium]
MVKDNKELTKDKFYLEVLKNIPEALIVCDKDYKVVFVSESFSKIFQIDSGIIGKKFQSLIRNTSKINCHICKGNPAKYIPQEDYSHQATLIDETGKDILIRISHSIMPENGGYISILSPMSNLVCLNQAQIDFVSTVSHELRTPMTSIKGFADTLINAGDQLTKEQQTRFITIIKSQADRLTRLVENLLTVSRLETKKHKSVFRSLSLEYFVDRVIFALKNKYSNHIFKTEICKDIPCVWADQDKLEQIFTNLIDNAAKYSQEGTEVKIKAYLCPEDPDKIIIEVIDQGVGIPEEFIPKIFNKFSRIDNPLTRQVQGTGLGLYITKALTESLGGKISLKSYNNGTIFKLELLVATPERQARQGLAEV